MIFVQAVSFDENSLVTLDTLGGFKCSRQSCPIHALLFNCYLMEDGVFYHNLAPHLVVIVTKL